MLLTISFQPSRRKSYPKRIFCLRCDNCGVEFTRQNILAEFALSHTCSRKCKYERHAKLQTKYDVVDRICVVCDRTFRVKENKTQQICSTVCQVTAQLKGGIIDKKKRQVMLERYGTDNPQQLQWVRDKSRMTNLERYGTEVGSQSSEVKARMRATNQQRFGVDWHTQSENFAHKAKETWRKHYGVDHPMRADEVKAKYDFAESWRKAHETKKKNGTYASSYAEKRFHERLCQLYPNVETQVRVKHDDGFWLIDFQVGDTYVEFDGVYWHGLDRPIELIRASMKPRDRAIAKHYDRDRQQSVWFPAHGMSLIRITDRQAKKLSDADLCRLLTSDRN